MSRAKIVLIMGLVLLLAACQQGVPATNQTNNSDISNITDTNDTMEGPVVVDRGVETEKDYDVLVTAVEGETVKLSPQAIDPDGDAIEYEFSEPFDSEGEWETEQGDAGEYEVTVTAFDGVDRTEQEILVVISEANMPPTMNCPDLITLSEGEILNIDCNIHDPEDDEVVIKYDGFVSVSKYRTTFKDAGTYTVKVTAWDKKNVDKKISEEITVRVKNLNLPPRIEFDFDSVLRGKEGDVISVDPKITDPDGDELSIEYSEPFDEDGVWETEIGDAGTYDASIIVSDGRDTVKKVFKVELAQTNTAPVIEAEDEITVKEGQTVDLDLNVYDRESEDVTVEISGFMESETYTTTYNDGHPGGCDEKLCTATYTVTVTASDGDLTSEKDIKVNVQDRNRPPVFRVPA